MSVYDDLLAQQKQIEAQLKALSPDAIQKTEREKVQADMQADINAFSSGIDSQISNTQNYYNKLENDTKTDYESQYERNAVQKLINEKQIAERNANLGLTDSGLNRTQQTAVQLSYANQKGDIDLARQNKLDELGLKLTEAVTTLQNNKASGIREITNQWNSYADTRAEGIYGTQYDGLVKQYNDIGNQLTKMYESDQKTAAELAKAQLDAETELYKAQIAAAVNQPAVSYGAGGTIDGGYIVSSKTGTLSRDYLGSLKDNGVDTVYSYNPDGSIKKVTYTDNNSGISASFDAGVNPYTGNMNKDLLNEDGEYDPSNAFDNGYQPNNIDGVKLKFNNAWMNVNGNTQRVFICGDKCYVWDGSKNEYFEVEEKYDKAEEKWYWDQK